MSSKAHGQTLTLMAVTMLVVTVMIFMTLAIGARVRRKLELDNVSDAAAYSSAMATARTMNSLALINRASASHWVAMAGIQADHVWGTMVPAYEEGCAAGAYLLSVPGLLTAPGSPGVPVPGIPGGPITCASDITGQKMFMDARKLFWHAELAQWNAPGAEAGDPIEFPSAANPTIIKRLPVGQSFGVLDKKVGDEQRQVWQATYDLAQIQLGIRNQLQNALQGPSSLANRIVSAAQVPLTVEQPVDATGRTPPWREVSDAVSPRWSDQMPLAEAAMGTRDSHFPSGGPMDWNTPDAPRNYQVAPAVAQQIDKIQNYLKGKYGGRSLICKPTPEYLLSTYFFRPSVPSAANGNLGGLPSVAGQYLRVGPGQMNGTEVLVGQIDTQVAVSFASTCSAIPLQVIIPVEATSVAFTNPSYYINGGANAAGVDTTAHYWGPCMNCNGTSSVNSPVFQNFWGRFDTEQSDPNQAPYFTEPHTHQYYLSPSELTAHQLGAEQGPDLGVMPGGLGFVFPQAPPPFPAGARTPGAGGAFGQPKSPVLLTRAVLGPGITPDPWDLAFKFRFTPTGAQIDLQKGSPAMVVAAATMASLSNGIAYYHRRRDTFDTLSWKEAPNLLNPYWHATLVPIDIDEDPPCNRSGRGSDCTPNHPARPVTADDGYQMTYSRGLTAYSQLYQQLKTAQYKGIQ